MKNVTVDLGANNLVADGSTDNTAHLNAAMAAWTTADGAWFWPAGQYNLNSKPNSPPNGMMWYGEGKGLTTIYGFRAAPSVTCVIDLTSTQNMTIKDLTCTTLDTANAAQQSFDVTSANNILFERVKMSNGFSGGIRASSSATNIRYLDGEITNIHQDPSASGFSGCLSNCLIEGNYFHDTSTESGGTRHCVYFNSNPGENVRGSKVRNNTFVTYGNGAAIAFKGDGSGSATGAGYSLSAVGNSFDTTSTSGPCLSAQGVQGVHFVGNNVYAKQPGASLFQINGDCWNFVIDSNVFYTPHNYFGGEFIVIQGGNGGGRVSNNMFAKANSYYELCYGVFVLGSTGNLEICNNTFVGMYCGVLLSTGVSYSPGAQGVGDIHIYNNNLNIPAGGTDVTSPAGAVVGLSNGQTAAFILDGQVKSIRIENNKVNGLNFNTVFTTGSFLGSSGNADAVQVQPFVPMTLASLLHSGSGSPAPTNVSVAPPVSFTAIPYGATGHAYVTSTT